MELKHRYYHLIAILIAAVQGLTFISTKVLINHELTSQKIFLYHFLIAYLGVWVTSPKRLFISNWQDELWLVAGGIFGDPLYFSTENIALGIAQASNVSFIIYTVPLLITVLSLLSYRSEKASKGLVYGSLLVLMRVGLTVFNGSSVLKISPIGDLLTLPTALSWTFCSLIIRKTAGRYPTIFITRRVLFYGALTILPAFPLHPLHPDVAVLPQPTVLFNPLFLVVSTSLIYHVLWNMMLKQLGAVRVPNYIYFSPLVAMIASFLILDEKITLVALGDATCVVCGVYWAEEKQSG